MPKAIKPTKQALRALLNITNPHNLCAQFGDPTHRIYLDYGRSSSGRGPGIAQWQVVQPGGKTDSDGPWYNHGHKTFMLATTHMPSFTERKEAARQLAVVWAREKYGITDWERDCYGAYQVAGTIERAAEALQRNTQVA